MTTTEAIQTVYLKATGKPTTLTSGTKYDKILGLLKFYQRRWGREPGVDWNTLYNPALSIGNVTATDSFDIDTSTVRVLSMTEGDVVKIMWTNGLGYTEYDIIAPDSMKDYFYGQNKESSLGNYCTRIGDQLVFNHTFTSNDPEFGGDIQIPCYTYPEELQGGDDEEIQVDDPDWLVLRCAAEYVRTDLIRKSEYSNLLSEANEAMARMIDDNGSQIDEVIMPWTPFAG